jgi:hypothetical protein
MSGLERFASFAEFIVLSKAEAADIASAAADAARLLRANGDAVEAAQLEQARDLLEDRLVNPPPAGN